jgi:putative DNA primase/helicase
LQCPPDYVAVAAITALGATIGRRIGIKPKQKADWIEIPNLWGAFIGRPGMLKSPSMGEGLKHIHRLEAAAAQVNEVARSTYNSDFEEYTMRRNVAAARAKEALKKNSRASIDLNVGDEPKVPTPIRYRTNDSSYESLGELLIDNPSGVLVERDELVSLLKHLDREDQAVARGFYLSGWSGTQPYTFDRIGRGTRHIDGVCISVLGNTQPARIGDYVRRANVGGAGGDGLIQRFGLMVWPDAPAHWRNVDEYPNHESRLAAWQVFERASKIDTKTAREMGAEMELYDKVPYLRFEEKAHADFLGWHSDLEQQLRAGHMSPALEGHLAKYRKLVPALALINHIADQGQGPVTHQALLTALAFALYLETHAKRLYGSSNEVERQAGQAILKRIRKSDLMDGFTARDIQRAGWSNLTERSQVQEGLDLLVELDHLVEHHIASGPAGGRPKVEYFINPRAHG